MGNNFKIPFNYSSIDVCFCYEFVISVIAQLTNKERKMLSAALKSAQRYQAMVTILLQNNYNILEPRPNVNLVNTPV